MRYLSILTAVVAFGLWNGLRAQPLSGSYTINGASNFSGGTFATIQEAFDSLNQRGASGPVIFTVEVDGNSPDWSPAAEPNTITLAGYACTNCRVTLQFSLNAVVSLAKAPATTQSNRFVIRLGGHTQSTLSNVLNAGSITNLTIIGSNNLIIQSTQGGSNSGTNTAVIGLVSTSNAPLNVSGLTLRNLRIAGNGRPRTFAGIYVGGDGSSSLPFTSAGIVKGLYIIGNSIDSVSRPIHIAGVRANFGTANEPIVVDSNSIGLASATSWAYADNIGAIHIRGSKFVRVRSNTVTGAQSGSNYQFSGVRLDSCEDFIVNANRIYGLKYTGSDGWGMYGIAVIMPGAFVLPNPLQVISNNMIADIVADGYATSTGLYSVSGIYVNAASANSNLNLAIVHNSISLFGDNTASNNNNGGGSAGICIGNNATGGLTIMNNIFQNNLRPSTGSNKYAYGIWIIPSSLSNTTINYNAYRVNAPFPNPANNIIARRGTTDFTSLGAFNSATGYEANGVALIADVPFSTPTDLHVNSSVGTQIINAGSTNYNGTPDFDGETRPIGGANDPGTAPDIGADELAGTQLVCPTTLDADVITLSPTSPVIGQNITVNVQTLTNLSGVLTLRWSVDGGATWISQSVSPSSFPYTFTPPTASSYPATLDVQLIASNVPNCPVLTPDTASASVTISCPTVTAGPVNIVQDTVLAGTNITFQAPSASAPSYTIQWSYNATTWNNLAYSGTFPATLTTPTSGIPAFPSKLYLRLVASSHSSCPADTSIIDSVVITDRSGNRLANAIPVSLAYNPTTQVWEATIQDNLATPGLSNEYGSGTGNLNPRGTGAREIFFLLTLPACMDSLQLSLCGGAGFDTYLSMINLSLADTIANDDGGCSLQSAFTAIAGLGSSPITPASALLDYVRDTMRLAQGDQVVIIVEAYSANSSNQGPFTLQIQGWAGSLRPAPNLGSDQTVCVSQGTLSLDATTTGATTYEWVVNSNVVSGANSATYNLPLSVGTHTVIARAIFLNPNGVACNDTTISSPITITVDPEPNASIAVGSTTYSSGATHNLSGTGSSVSETFTASSSVSGNSYQWELYNPGNTTTTPNATGSGGTFNHTFNASGLYTLILLSTNGACGPERDTLFVNVSLTTALGVGSGSFAAFPNPSTGSFTVVAPAAGSYDLRILDVAGKLVYADRMEGERKDLRLTLPAGTYQLLLSGEGKSGLIRLLITE